MLAPILSLPRELKDLFIDQLDLPSLRNLRLTSRPFHQLVSTSDGFKKCLHHKHVVLHEEHLRALISLSSHTVLASAVKHLTLSIPTYNLSGNLTRLAPSGFDPEGLDERKKRERQQVQNDMEWMQAQAAIVKKMKDTGLDVELLSEALRRFGRLQSLNISATTFVHREETMRTIIFHAGRGMIYVAAAQAYRTVMSALKTSEVEVETLCILSKQDRCAVPAAIVASATPSLSPATAKVLRKLELSISSELSYDSGTTEYCSRDRISSTLGIATSSLSNTEPAQLLTQLPHLEELNIHYYNMMVRRPESPKKCNLTTTLTALRLPRLRICSFAGVGFTSSSMLSFLGTCPVLEDLTLRNIHILEPTDNDWSSIFAHLCNKDQMPRLQRLMLESLHHERGVNRSHLVNLELEGDIVHRQVVIDEDEDDRSEPERTWEDIHEYLPYMYGRLRFRRTLDRKHLDTGLPFKASPGGRPLGSGQWMDYESNMSRDFGPPMNVRGGGMRLDL